MDPITTNSGKNCENCGMGCKCGHHYVKPIAIILIGVTFLLQAFNVIDARTLSIAWPILLIIAGATKLCGCCSK